MKKFISPRIFSVLFLLAMTNFGFAQRNSHPVAQTDSMIGFNYLGAMTHAKVMSTDKERFEFLKHAKRTFKIQKYDLYPQAIADPTATAKSGNNNGTLQGPQPVGCANVDFESQNTTGWTVTGDNAIMTGGVDPYGGYPRVYPGGTASLRLNDDNISGTKTTFSAQASRVIPVTAANSQFQLHFAFDILNFPHPSTDAAIFYVQFFNAANTLLACPQFSCYYANPPGQFFGMPAGVAQTAPVTGQNIGFQVYPVTYVPWQTVALDLTPYIGQNITAKITCNWCRYNYDWGYCYIDADCFSTAPSNTTCPGPLCGPGGMASYTWTPPVGPVVTTSCITALTPGTYTCAYTPFATCGAAVQTATYLVTPPPTAGFTTTNTCASYTITNTGAGPPAIQTYSFLGVGAPASFTTTNATSPVNFPTAGTYTIVQTITLGSCVQTFSQVVNPPPAPNPAFNFVSPQCFTGNAFTFNAVVAGGVQTYSFNPVAGAPAAGATGNYGPVSFTAPGTYTVTHTINTGGCTNITTSVVVINPQPVPVVNNNGPLCTGSNLVLTGGGGTTYNWTGPLGFTSALQNPTVTAVGPANAGVYNVTVTALGCTSTGSTTVVVTTPTAAANNTGPYCAGTTIQLNSPTAATSYTWNGPGGFVSNLQNPTILNATPGMTGSYTVLLSFGTCTATANTNVVVNALPIPLANSNSPVCAGTPINFTGGGGTSYAWAGPAFASALQNPSIASAIAANAGTYTLTVTDVNNCTNTITTNVVVNALPIIAVNNPSVCLNQTINITSNGGATYAWTGPGGFVSAVQNPVLPNATLGMSGAYTVTVTSAAGCTSTAVSNVAVYPLPNPAITSNTPCVGSTLNLTGTGGAVYGWLGPNNFNSNTQNPNITGVSLAAAGVYTLLVTSGTCSASITSVISINPLPVPVINSNSPVCIGMPINLTGTGGVSYAWTGPAGFSDPNQNPNIPVSILANAGFYTLTVTDANNCSASTSAGVVVNPQPIVNATGTTVCQNANATLGANGGVTYSWTGPGGFVSASQNPIIVGATMASAGQYTVLVTDANTCTNTAVTSLGVNPAPTPNIITNSPICINNVLVMGATGGVSYLWNGPGGFTSTSPNPTITANSLSVGGIYAVSAVDANGCIGSATVNTVINPNPTANILSSPNKGCAPLCVTYTCVTSGTVATCQWTLGDGVNPFGSNVAGTCYNAAGIYSINVSVTDANGCPGAASYTAEVYPKPIADFNYAPYHPIVNDGVTFVDASFNANIAAWNWYFMSTAQYQSNVQNPFFVYDQAGEYPITLVVKSDKGCVDTLVRIIIVGEDFGIFVPNAFTPNGDGLNDVFQPKGFGIVKYQLRIFNRWGEELMYTEDFYHAWDGMYHGKLSPEDVYTWKINVTDVFSKAHEYTGHVTLIK